MCNYLVAQREGVVVQDRIEREVVVAAPPERVWEIITQAEHVGKWFSDSAEVDLRPGGTIVLRFEKHGTQYATIEKIEAPRYFSYRWKPGLSGEKPGSDDSTLVEFTLEPYDGQTRVRVVETGFSRLPLNEDKRAEQFESNTEGWAIQLRDLREYLEALAA
ncbi:MAG: hypothetical protein NVS3B28_28350 [Candidatus Velthaea sp.]